MAKHRAPAEKESPSTPASPASETYTVLARRYRPQGFGDLVGQEPISRALTNAITSNRVAHAYLFTGARGVGKTSTARILAKALQCVKGPTPTPCDECEICRSIASGEDVDVIEIDGASNNGVDDIRDIRNNVQYLPQRARFKIYIIDEVHMLSKGAFNALLKTLEEPPAHVKFIFATTEVDKVPITILSRCQRFDFAGISLPKIVDRLQSILQREKLQADPAALELIARRAGGSMRDAQSLLDQILAFGGDRLTSDQVHRLLGTAGDERILGLVDAILANDNRKALDLLDEACVGGLQLGELVDQLILYWRDLMLVNCGGTEGRDFSISERHYETLRTHARQVTLDAILAGLDVMSATRARMRGSNHARTLVEMALVRLGRLGDLVSLTQLAQWVGQVRLDPRAAITAPPGVQAAGGQDAVKKKPLTAPPEALPEAVPLPTELTEETWPAYLGQIVSLVGGMLARELGRAKTPAILGPNSLVFRFDPAYNQSRQYVQQPERLARIEEAIRKLTGKLWQVRVEEDAGSADNSPPTITTAPVKPRGAGREEAEKVPLIRRAMDVLGATVQRVDDGFGVTESRRPANDEGM